MVSIILSTFNRAHTLKETIDSILGQTYTDFELILVDDGSTDNTPEIVQEYEDSRIRFFCFEKNRYYCVAANFGIKQAKGEYIAFATSDDTWEPDKLEVQINYLNKRPECGACFTFSQVINESSEKTNEQFEMLSGLLIQNYHTQKDWIQRFIFEGNCLCHPSAVVKKEVLDEIGDYNLLYCQAADMDMWIRIVRKYPIHVIGKKLVNYRCYKNPDDQISGADELKAARFLNEHMIIRRVFINDLTDEEMIRFFGDCFKNKDACSHVEIEIEKAFLLMNCTKGLPDFHILGIEKFEELLRNSEMVQVLEEKYHVRPKDIYQWNLGHFYMDFGIHVKLAERDRTILILKEKLRKETEYGKALQRQRKEVTEKLQSALARANEDISRLEGELRAMQVENERQKEELKCDREKCIATELRLGIKEKELGEMEEEKKRITEVLNKALLENLQMKEKGMKGR